MPVDTTKVLPVVKKCLGIDENDTNWDIDLLVSINMAMSHLNQLGCDFVLIDANTLWTALTTDEPLKSLITSYLWMKTKQIFDPSQSSNASDAMTAIISELEFRITVYTEER